MTAALPTVSDLIKAAERLWPLSGAESWDAVGLLSGDPRATVSHVRLAVDATVETAEEAVENGAGMLLVHHPLLLRGVTSVSEDQFKGAVIAKLVRGSCALYAAHTNADVVETGTSAVLATALGLLNQRAIAEIPGSKIGIGRVGELPEQMTLGAFARKVADVLPPTASGVRVSGDFESKVRTISLCAGAGDSYLEFPAVLSSDVYLTSDLRHHPASAFRENAKINSGPALIDVSHWAAEWLWLEVAAKQLQFEFPELPISVSDLRTDPWDFTVVQ